MGKIHSMTAFARESKTTEQGVLTVELRSVNHRYLDCSFKLPDNLRALEPRLREKAGRRLARGKLDCLLRLQVQADGRQGDLSVNPEQLDKLVAATAIIGERLPRLREPSALEVLQFPGICSPPEQSDEALQRSGEELFDATLEALTGNRLREGEKMAALILERLEQVAQQVAATRSRIPELKRQQQERLTTRIAEVAAEVDHNRLEQELVYLAQKADVDEELDRLDAHVDEVRRALNKGGPCGRRLDFLMQELNREANTLSSKSNAASTTQSAVELKVLIEQMREQIQNIE